MILTKKENSFFLETFEIFNNSYQTIPLLTKENADSNNIKHFIIENDDILFIKINHSKYNGNNDHVYVVDLINFDICYEMRLENFLIHKRESIRLCKYLWNDEFKKFKVKLIDGELYEV